MPEYSAIGRNLTRGDRTLHGGEVRPTPAENQAEFARLHAEHAQLCDGVDWVTGLLGSTGKTLAMRCVTFLDQGTHGTIILPWQGGQLRLEITWRPG